jgi:hypothetical protein
VVSIFLAKQESRLSLKNRAAIPNIFHLRMALACNCFVGNRKCCRVFFAKPYWRLRMLTSQLSRPVHISHKNSRWGGEGENSEVPIIFYDPAFKDTDTVLVRTLQLSGRLRWLDIPRPDNRRTTECKVPG